MLQQFGLVICGGKSNRMGEDKSLLNYHGIPQRYYLYELLQTVSEKVFLSCNREQANTVPATYNVIIDAPQYENIGPMAAVLSAFDLHNDVSFLAVGCDYPFIKKTDMQKLIEGRNNNSMAVSYFNQAESIHEPLLAVYESSSHESMKMNFKEQKYSLRHFLREINAAKVIPSSGEIIKSIDTPEEYRKALQKIKSENPSPI